MTLGQLTEVRAQQVAHRAVFEPLPMQAPLAARRDQPIHTKGLEHPIPPRALAAGLQTLRPELVQSQLVVQLAGQPAGAPLPWPAQPQLRELDSHDLALGHGHLPVRGEQVGVHLPVGSPGHRDGQES